LYFKWSRQVPSRFIYIVSLLVIAGLYLWLLRPEAALPVDVCLFKHMTGIPCPGCGGIRATKALLSGNFLEALTINPLTVLLHLFILFGLVRIIMDLVRKEDKMIRILTSPLRPVYMWILAVLLVSGWIYVILRGN
jgi:hypothetical protein